MIALWGFKIAILFGFGLSVVWPAHVANADVTVKPRTGAGAAAPVPAPAAPKAESKLAISVKMPLGKLETIINQYQFNTSAKGWYGEGKAVIDVIKLARSGEDEFPLQLTAPFKVTGKLLGASINEKGDAIIKLGIRIGSDWCPIVEFGAISVILEGPSAASVSELVGTHVLKGQLEKWATCDNLKSAIGDMWRPASITIKAKPKDFFLNIQPRSLALSSITVTGQELTLAGAIAATATLASKAVKSTALPLPQVGTIQHGGSAAASEIEASISLNLNMAISKP